MARKFTKIVAFRLDAALLAILLASANAAGVSVSEYLRMLITQANNPQRMVQHG